jgi:hypothetical protein
MARVTICGPNLYDQSHGTFHVHAEGCADLVKHARREPEYKNGWTIEADSKHAVIAEIYPPEQFEYDENDPEDFAPYETDIYFFPCVTLPKEA